MNPLNNLISLFHRSADDKNGFTLIEIVVTFSHFVVSPADATSFLHGSGERTSTIRKQDNRLVSP